MITTSDIDLNKNRETIEIMRKKLSSIPNGGFSVSGVVWDVDGVTEIQDREDVKLALAAEQKVEIATETCTIEERVVTLELKIKQLLEEK